MKNYKTEFTDVELGNAKDNSKYSYELGINLYQKKMVLIYSREELKGLADFINEFLENN